MKPASKNIVVTGGGGFIASHLINHLIKNKFNVLSLSRSPIVLPKRNPRCAYETVDLTDFEKLKTVVKAFNQIRYITWRHVVTLKSHTHIVLIQLMIICRAQ